MVTRVLRGERRRSVDAVAKEVRYEEILSSYFSGFISINIRH